MVKKTLLDNGFRILLDPMPSLHSATVSVWVDYSGCATPPDQAGIAHFLEHLLFKGQPATFAAIQHIEDIGGTINAVTDKETSCFYAHVLEDQVAEALKSLATVVCQPVFEPSAVATEKQVIRHELTHEDHASKARLLERLINRVWWDHPLAQPVIGTPESVEAITVEALEAFYQTHYIPSRLVLSIAGQFDESAILALSQSLFSSLPVFSNTSTISTSELPLPVYHPVWEHLDPDTDQATLCLGFPGMVADSPDRFALGVLDMILGGGTGSRLFQTLRQGQGLVYSIHTLQLLYRNAGLFSIYAQTHPHQLNRVYDVILDTLNAMVQDGPSSVELNRAKQRILGHLLLSMESTQYRATRNARTEIYQGNPLSIAEVQQQIAALEDLHIQQLSRTLLRPENLSVVYTGSTTLSRSVTTLSG